MPLSEASAPLRTNLSPALGIALGFLCYQVYYAFYSPGRVFGFGSSDRGGELLRFLTPSQRELGRWRLSPGGLSG